MKLLILYLITVNALGLLLMLSDKHRAKENLWRIPERTLLTVAMVGGSPGCIMGMYLFRHKTRKPKFYMGLPVILTVQLVLFIIIYANIPVTIT